MHLSEGAAEISPGPKIGRSVCYSPRKRPETSVSAKTRRSCSSRPGEAAREVAYRFGGASMSTLRKNCRDRVGFREPENGLVTGDTGHKTPRKVPETCAVSPKTPQKPHQTSPTTSPCMSRKTPRKSVRVQKSARRVCYSQRKRPDFGPFPRNQE